MSFQIMLMQRLWLFIPKVYNAKQETESHDEAS